MPFKTAKQKKAIDAAAHNPKIAKNLGINMKDAKKMSAHGKGQKFNETQEDPPFDGPYSKAGEVKKDRYGNIIKDKNIAKHLAKKGRAEVEKTTDKKVKEAVITSGPNKGKQWSPKTPGPTNPNYKPFDKNGIPSPDDGATAPPPGYKAPKSMKKAEVDSDTTVAATDDQELNASMEHKGKKVKEAKKNDGNLANNAKPYDKVTRGDVIAGRLGKDEMGGKKVKEELKGGQKKLDVNHNNKIDGDDLAKLRSKKKVKESTEAQLLRIAKQAMDTVKALREAKQEAARIKHMPISESDEYFAGLQSRLNKQIKG